MSGIESELFPYDNIIFSYLNIIFSYLMRMTLCGDTSYIQSER